MAETKPSLKAAPPRVVDGPLDLGEIYRQHAARVSRWVRRLLGPQGDAEDALQEIFLVAQRRLPDFRGDSQITTWLYGITVRVIQDRRRRERWRRWFRGGGSDASETASCAPTPLEALESRRATERTYAVLNSLPERDRTALILFELEGLSGEEIAAVTGDPIGAIWVRLHRARTRFIKKFTALERGDQERGGRV